MKSELSKIEFANIKSQTLCGKDFSRKGNIDEPIVDIVSIINGSSNYVTTSSCSGRIIVISKERNQCVKRGCKWVFVSHETIREDEFIESLKTVEGDLVVKFEPFILHVLCRTLAKAKLLSTALQSGYRNSGITLGKHGKITLAVRSTLNMEVPISRSSELLVPEEYLKYLTVVANEKMETNKEQFTQFYTALQKVLKSEENDSEEN